MIRLYLEIAIAWICVLAIPGGLLVLQFGLLRKAWLTSRFARPEKAKTLSPTSHPLPHVVYVFSFLLLLPIFLVFVPLIFILMRNTYDDLKPNGFVDQMRAPVPQSVVQDLCDWQWIDAADEPCTQRQYTHFAVVDILRDNVQRRPQAEVLERLGEYRLRCSTRNGEDYCSGTISDIAYQLRFEADGIHFRHINHVRRSS